MSYSMLLTAVYKILLFSVLFRIHATIIGVVCVTKIGFQFKTRILSEFMAHLPLVGVHTSKCFNRKWQ